VRFKSTFAAALFNMIACAGLAFRLILFDAVPTVANALPIILAETRAPLLLTGWVLFVAVDDLMALVLNLCAFLCAHAMSLEFKKYGGSTKDPPPIQKSVAAYAA
jgi:hypothetical protein